jgi:hypothetical protein
MSRQLADHDAHVDRRNGANPVIGKRVSAVGSGRNATAMAARSESGTVARQAWPRP